MMNRQVVGIGLGLVVGLAFTQVAARGTNAATSESVTYTVDPVHSVTIFRIMHMNVSPFYGRFNETRGTFTINDADDSACVFDVTIPIDSIDTHNTKRDQHLESSDYFDMAKFPEANFTSKRVRKTGPNTFEVTGELKFMDTSRPITVTLERTGQGEGRGGAQLMGFEGTFTIKRSEWGMTGGLGGLGDEVRVTVALQGRA